MNRQIKDLLRKRFGTDDIKEAIRLAGQHAVAALMAENWVQLLPSLPPEATPQSVFQDAASPEFADAVALRTRRAQPRQLDLGPASPPKPASEGSGLPADRPRSGAPQAVNNPARRVGSSLLLEDVAGGPIRASRDGGVVEGRRGELPEASIRPDAPVPGAKESRSEEALDLDAQDDAVAGLDARLAAGAAQQGGRDDMGGVFGQGDQGVEIRGTRRGTGVTSAGAMPMDEIRRLTESHTTASGNTFEESPSIVVPSSIAGQLTDAERRFMPYIIDQATKFGVPVGVLYGLLKRESNFNPGAVSGANSNSTRDYGIAQINSDTLRGLGLSTEWAMNPLNAIAYAARRLGDSIKKYGSVAVALIEYNGGAGRAEEYASTGTWPYAAAESYVSTILEAAAALDPQNVTQYQFDGPMADEHPIFNPVYSAAADVNMVAQQVAQQLLGRDVTPKELGSIRDSLRKAEHGQQAAAFSDQMFQQTDSGNVVTQTGQPFGQDTPGGTWGTADGGVPWAGGRQAWGGQERNGLIDESKMTRVDGALAHPQAASAMEAMLAAAAADGINLGVGGGYRTFARQQEMSGSNPLAARIPANSTEGRSIHGWGLAFDMEGVGGFGTSAYKWMEKHGGRFGFTNPGWARQDGSKPEHWHWEYIGGGPGMGGGTEAPASLTASVNDIFKQRYPNESAAFGFYQQGTQLMRMLTQGGVVV